MSAEIARELARQAQLKETNIKLLAKIEEQKKLITETDDNYFRKIEAMKRNNEDINEQIISLEAALKVQRNQGSHMTNMAEYFK